MKVVLLQDVKNTGKKGQVVEVADGFGRNFLIRNGIARVADKVAVLESAEQEKARAYHTEQERLSAIEKAKQIEGKTILLKLKTGEGGKLFGSVTTKEIEAELSKIVPDIDRRKIELKNPIKNLGIYPVSIKLHPKVSADFKIEVIAE